MMATQSSAIRWTVLAVIVGITLVNLPSIGSSKLSKKCPEQRTVEMDACAVKMGFLGDHTFKVPKNVSSMGKFCDNLKDSISCIQAYSRDCLEGFTKQLMGSLLKRGKQQYSLICQDDESKRNFMSRMSCLTDNQIDRFHRCMDASIARFEFIAANAEPDNKLSSLCCSYQIFNMDIDSTLDSICGKPKDRKSSINEFIERIAGGTAGEFFTLICDGHRSMEECKKSAKTQQILPQLENLTQRAHQGKLRPKSKSLVPPLLEILDGSST